jgi:hypothetical protein
LLSEEFALDKYIYQCTRTIRSNIIAAQVQLLKSRVTKLVADFNDIDSVIFFESSTLASQGTENSLYISA